VIDLSGTVLQSKRDVVKEVRWTEPTIVGGHRERWVVTRRGRGKTVCARGAHWALLGGPSTSPLGGQYSGAAPMDTFSILFVAVCALIVGLFVFKFSKFGGIKAAMFGASIERTIGEARATSGPIVKASVKVHVLDGGPDRAVGLEFVSKSFASYQMRPVTLSESEARNLIRFLENAIVEAGDRAT